MRVVDAAGYDEKRDAISHDWIRWLARHDVVPVLIPNVIESPARYAERERLDGLILTNGNDVAGHPRSDASPQRDATEAALLDWALAARKPVFAVCRGIHMVNAHFGGRVRADLAADTRQPAGAHIARRHRVRFEARFAAILGAPGALTNSYHRQGLLAADVAPALLAFAVCEEDGVIEGLVHRQLPVLAIQWHPEREGSCTEVDGLLLRRLLAEQVFWHGG